MTNLEDLPGVGKETATKLRDGGILTIMGVATQTPSQLKDLIGMSESASRKIINAARELCKLGFELAKDYEAEQNKFKKIGTGCKAVDALLGGGLELGTTLEAFGEYSSGKSQLGHLLAVSTLKTFPDSYVIYIDTENCFSPNRIRGFAKGFGIDQDYAMKHIKLAKASTSDHQILLTENIEKEIINNKLDVKLVVIDSLMNHFRAEFLGRGSLANRQQMINGYLHKVGILASNYRLAVYLTNQVQSDPGQMFGNPIKPVGGNIVGHFATTRVYMRTGQKGSRKMIMKDSPSLPEGEASFMITETGFEDIDDK
jgi:DNA repair protein RadA